MNRTIKLNINGVTKEFLASEVTLSDWKRATELRKAMIVNEKNVVEFNRRIGTNEGVAIENIDAFYNSSLSVISTNEKIMTLFTEYVFHLYKGQFTYDELINGLDVTNINEEMDKQIAISLGK